MKAIIGKKVGMSQIFDENGKVIPVTVIEAGPCVVVQKKTAEKDGYNAVQLGYEDIPERKLSKPEMGHLNKAGVAPKKYLREFDLENAAELNAGDIIKADTFKKGDFVDVTGTTKGHGYQGVIKRHGAHRLKETHGSGPVVRHAGSMGANSSPSKIFKGKIGAGQMGDEQVTVQNLDVVKVDPELGVIAVRGAIPGPKGGLVYIKSTAKTIIEKKGSSPRGTGSKMFVFRDGSTAGSIGGGKVEFEAGKHAVNIRNTETKVYELGQGAGDLGMICGGTVRVLFEPVNM